MYESVWSAVNRIPLGRVSTYGTVARIAGFPRHARIVGNALRSVPEGMDIPWHRVINSRGMMSLSGQSRMQQISLLREEGVDVKRNTVNLKKFGWPDSHFTR